MVFLVVCFMFTCHRGKRGAFMLARSVPKKWQEIKMVKTVIGCELL